MSAPNTSWSRPATALPSSISLSISASRRSEALCLDSLRGVPEVHERFCDGLGERGRTADVDARPLGWARADFGQHLGVDQTRMTSPTRRLRRRQRMHDREAVAVQPLELVAIDD